MCLSDLVYFGVTLDLKKKRLHSKYAFHKQTTSSLISHFKKYALGFRKNLFETYLKPNIVYPPFEVNVSYMVKQYLYYYSTKRPPIYPGFQCPFLSASRATCLLS